MGRAWNCFRCSPATLCVLALNLALNNNNPAIKRGGQMGRRNPFTFNPPLALYFFCFCLWSPFRATLQLYCEFLTLRPAAWHTRRMRNSQFGSCKSRQATRKQRQAHDIAYAACGPGICQKKEERKVSGTESICLMYLTLSEHFLWCEAPRVFRLLRAMIVFSVDWKVAGNQISPGQIS